MFEATLHAADPDRQRLQRLSLAALIALSSTATALASVVTLGRLGIDRVVGPAQQLELLQFSLLPAPRLDPPPPPPPADGGAGPDDGPSDPAPVVILEEDVESSEIVRDAKPSDALTQPRAGKPVAGGGNPILGGLGCPGGACTGLGPAPGPGGSCTGPHCGSSPLPASTAAPAEVAFSALRCLYCGDPDQAALRKAGAHLHARRGRVEVKFCVDRAGRVEAGSLRVTRSFGVATVDEVTTDALERWRFAPLKIGNVPRRACSKAVFDIRFD